MSGRSKHMRTKDPHSKYEKQYEQSVTSALTKKTIVDNQTKSAKRTLSDYNRFIKENSHKVSGPDRLKKLSKLWKKAKVKKTIQKSPKERTDKIASIAVRTTDTKGRKQRFCSYGKDATLKKSRSPKKNPITKSPPNNKKASPKAKQTNKTNKTKQTATKYRKPNITNQNQTTRSPVNGRRRPSTARSPKLASKSKSLSNRDVSKSPQSLIRNKRPRQSRQSSPRQLRQHRQSSPRQTRKPLRNACSPRKSPRLGRPPTTVQKKLRFFNFVGQ